MATVTGFTADRMLTIENTTVVSGQIQGDNLLLLTREGTPIDAGNVRGPVGPQGPIGEVSEAELASELATTRVPAGTISMFAGDTAPSGWLMCDGSAVDRTTYADLFAALQTKYGVGNGTTTFNLPDIQNRFPVGKGASSWSDTLNKKGGAKDLIVVSHAHAGPSHSHSISSHSHSASGYADAQGAHVHATRTEGVSSYGYVAQPSIASPDAAAGGNYNKWGVNTYGGYPSGDGNRLVTDQQGSHNHNISVTLGGTALTTAASGTGSTGTAGSDGTDGNLPPFVVVNFIIKV